MEFWGVEVPAGNPTSCSPGDGMYLHVSQAALGESKEKNGKGIARVVLKVQVDDSEVVLGTLSEGKCDQMPLDLVFDREFTVSHNSSSSSVYICGYRTEAPEEYGSEEEESEEEEDEDEDDDEEEEDAPVPVAVQIVSNGAAAAKQVKPAKGEDVAKKTDDKAQALTDVTLKAEKKSVKKQVVESSSDEEDGSDDEDEGMGHPFVSDLASESDDEFDAGDDSDEEMDEDDDDEDDDGDEDESDESEEEELAAHKIPVNQPSKPGKKRAAEELARSAEKKSKMDASSKPGQSPGKKAGKTDAVTPAGKVAAPAEVKTPTDKGAKPVEVKTHTDKEAKPVEVKIHTDKGAKPVEVKIHTDKGAKTVEVKTPTDKAAKTVEVKTPTDKGAKPARTPKGTPTAPPTTPVSERKIGTHKCVPCDRMFVSESALTQHTAVKHAAKA